MPTTTAEKTKIEATEPSAETPQTIGTRAAIWDPSKDPTCYELPRSAVNMRAFVFAYLNDEAIDITPLSPSGAVVPQFKTLTLQPGLNWVEGVTLDEALAAAESMGQESQRVTRDVQGSIDRLRMASKQGLNPISQQIKANAIKILQPLPKALMTGTLSDYGLPEITEICAVVNDAIEVESWLASIASNSVNPHPQKGAVEKLLKKTIADINAGNR